MTAEEIAAEEARAALWRAQASRRVAFQSALWASLAAPPQYRARLAADWAPLQAWLLERNEPPLDSDDPLEIDPLGISDSVNVGR